jgi:hypothetical protein
MNCIEALQEQLEQCSPCRMKSKIIEFEELPISERMNFDYYDNDKHFIIYCTKCEVYKLLGET